MGLATVLRSATQALASAQAPAQLTAANAAHGRGAQRTESMPGIVFPGCGIFYWWQAGVISALSQRVDLSSAQFAGASGGALNATLAACGVTDAKRSFGVALRLCEQSGAMERGAWGLWGIWGGLVREWLDELLPPDADKLCNGRVHILVHEISASGGSSRHVSEFDSRDDLISACLASIHIPLLMDGHLTASFRGGRYVDPDLPTLLRGAKSGLRLPADASPGTRVSYAHDQRLRAKYPSAADVLRLVSAEGVRELVRWGEEHGDAMDTGGDLARLESPEHITRG